MPPDTPDHRPSAPKRAITARAALEGFGEEAPSEDWDRAPLYRVVEVVRDAEGRLRKEGRIWHTDLNHLRRFGRAVASNASAHKVMIADHLGDVIEELPVAAPEDRAGCWGGGWQDMPLPPRPPVKRSPVKQKPGMSSRPVPDLAMPQVEEVVAASAAQAVPEPAVESAAVQTLESPGTLVESNPADNSGGPAFDNPMVEHETDVDMVLPT
ncbi:MAG: hypothetical protein RLZZ618_1422 [Pseudomonadota bacterium]